MSAGSVYVHPTADVAEGSQIGEGTRIWHQAQVMPDVIIGNDCTLGKGAFVGSGSRIGRLVKVGNYANVFGATVEDTAFIAPMACLLEDPTPRSTTADGTRKNPADFTRRPVTVRAGATIGAGAIVLPGVTVGRYAMVAAGAVVGKDVGEHVLVAGNPARALGWVCRCGLRLDESLRCECRLAYRQTETGLELLTTD